MKTCVCTVIVFISNFLCLKSHLSYLTINSLNHIEDNENDYVDEDNSYINMKPDFMSIMRRELVGANCIIIETGVAEKFYSCKGSLIMTLFYVLLCTAVIVYDSTPFCIVIFRLYYRHRFFLCTKYALEY